MFIHCWRFIQRCRSNYGGSFERAIVYDLRLYAPCIVDIVIHGGGDEGQAHMFGDECSKYVSWRNKTSDGWYGQDNVTSGLITSLDPIHCANICKASRIIQYWILCRMDGGIINCLVNGSRIILLQRLLVSQAQRGEGQDCAG